MNYQASWQLALIIQGKTNSLQGPLNFPFDLRFLADFLNQLRYNYNFQSKRFQLNRNANNIYNRKT